MPNLDAVVKAYDVRGTVPDQFDESLARAFGVAFATYNEAPLVVVATTCARRGLTSSLRSKTVSRRAACRW